MRPAKGESKAIPQVRIGLNDARALLAKLKGMWMYQNSDSCRFKSG